MSKLVVTKPLEVAMAMIRPHSKLTNTNVTQPSFFRPHMKLVASIWTSAATAAAAALGSMAAAKLQRNGQRTV